MNAPGKTGEKRGETAAVASPASAQMPPTAVGIVAWMVPGLGHWLLGRRVRGVAFFVLVVGAVALGASLEGNLGTTLAAPPLALLRTLGCMAAGLPYAVLRFVVHYVGSPQAPGYEYGSAFLVSAGLMNFLAALDAFDIGAGRKQ